jgi:hypothetical protein
MATTAEKVVALIQAKVPKDSREYVLQMVKDHIDNVPQSERIVNRYKERPVSIETFIKSPKYMKAANTIYPVVMDELREMNNGAYVEAVLTGGIGSGKTTAALYTTAYQLYLLSIMENPHEEYGLDPSSEIMFIFQNKTATLAKTVGYRRFKSMLEHSTYFNTRFRWDKNIESKLVFPNRIEVLPVSGTETATLGQNVMGGMIDELNYMDRVEDSKQVDDGEEFDQAIRLYNSISRRRKTRFAKRGKLPGILCLVSSRKYPGQFTDTKEAEREREIAKTGKSVIYLYDHTVWEIKPWDYGEERFHVFIGDKTRQAYILGDDEEVSAADRSLIRSIPLEFRIDFDTDIINALREVAGVSTVATNPFLANTELVVACFKGGMQSILSRAEVEFETEALRFHKKRFDKPYEMRYIHVDLGLTSDSAGIVCGFVDKFVQIRRSEKVVEIMPLVKVDFALRVKPPQNGEIHFEKIRTMIYKLAEAGLNICWVSFDSYQSVDSIQTLQMRGFDAGTLSMDTSTVPYEMLRSALYDSRVEMPLHQRLHSELLGLERDLKKGKIDHPPRGSKDISDALAGVVFGLTQKIRIWVHHGLSPRDVPRAVMEAGQQHKIRAPKGGGATQTRRLDMDEA